MLPGSMPDCRLPPLSRWDRALLGYGRLGKTLCLSSRVKKHKMGPIGCPETSVRNYHYTLRNIPDERWSYWDLLTRQRFLNLPYEITVVLRIASPDRGASIHCCSWCLWVVYDGNVIPYVLVSVTKRGCIAAVMSALKPNTMQFRKFITLARISSSWN
jgi:hypothetical protein